MGMRLRRAATTKRTTTRNGGTQSEWARRREPRSVGWHHDGVKEHEERTNGEGGRESGYGTRSDLAGPEPVEPGDREEVAVGVAHATAARLRLGLSEGEEEEPAGEGGHRHQQRADEGRKREGRHRCGVWVGSLGRSAWERDRGDEEQFMRLVCHRQSECARPLSRPTPPAHTLSKRTRTRPSHGSVN